jgi:hypothetical protein
VAQAEVMKKKLNVFASLYHANAHRSDGCKACSESPNPSVFLNPVLTREFHDETLPF